jgi:hypothetical protein
MQAFDNPDLDRLLEGLSRVTYYENSTQVQRVRKIDGGLNRTGQGGREVRTGQVRTGEVIIGQVRTGEVSTGQDRTGQNRDRMEQDWSGWEKSGQNRSEQGQE